MAFPEHFKDAIRRLELKGKTFDSTKYEYFVETHLARGVVSLLVALKGDDYCEPEDAVYYEEVMV